MKRVLVLILLLGSFGGTLAQEILENKNFRFSMKKPLGWISDLNINHNFNLDRNEGENLFTFYKYRRGENLKEINPMINVSVEYFGTDREKFMKRYLDKYSWKENYYITHQIIKKPEAITINGNTAITGTVHFKYNSHGTPKTSFRKGIYYILHEKHVFKIVFIDDYTTEINTALFDELASSIKIIKPQQN